MALDLSHLVLSLATLALGITIGKRLKPVVETRLEEPLLDRTPEDSSPEEEKLGWGERLFGTVFLSGWLIGWSAGIVMVAGQLASGGSGADLFLTGWMIAAIAGWFAAVAALIQLLRGKRPAFWKRR